MYKVFRVREREYYGVPAYTIAIGDPDTPAKENGLPKNYQGANIKELVYQDGSIRKLFWNNDDELEIIGRDAVDVDYQASFATFATDGGRTLSTGTDDNSEFATDGGTLQLDSRHWMPTVNTDTSSPHACRNCGAQHTLQYVRVYGDNRDTLCHCHDCSEPEICGRDMKQGAGSNPNYDPTIDRGKTTEHYPLFSSGGDGQ